MLNVNRVDALKEHRRTNMNRRSVSRLFQEGKPSSADNKSVKLPLNLRSAPYHN
jgi:hypothetical protein